MYMLPVLVLPRFLLDEVHGGCTDPSVTPWRYSSAEKSKEGGLGTTRLLLHLWVDRALLT